MKKNKHFSIYTFLLIPLFSIVSCNCNKDLWHANNEIEMLRNIVFTYDEDTSSSIRGNEYCYSTEAVVIEKSYYDTDKGSACLTFLLPKDFSLFEEKEKRDSKNNRIYFKATGKDLQLNSLEERIITVKGFSKVSKSNLFVYLTMEYEKTDCENLFERKHKGSVVNGEPFIPPCIIEN
jgi:hypothetical protein